MKVLGFKAFYHARIVMQILEGYSGQDFSAYVGIILDGPVSHTPYETVESGGGGQEIPNAVKMSYADAKANFGRLIGELKAQGYYWRD